MSGFAPEPDSLTTLIGIGIAGANYADAVVGELVVRARQLDFGHVAGYTTLFGDRTWLGRRRVTDNVSDRLRGYACGGLLSNVGGVRVGRTGGVAIYENQDFRISRKI